MIKGVNRQVLEIHDTGNKYFEKALFFVKPEYSTLSENRLRDAIQKTFGDYNSVPKSKSKKALSILFRIFTLIVSASFGAFLSFLFFNQ